MVPPSTTPVDATPRAARWHGLWCAIVLALLALVATSGGWPSDRVMVNLDEQFTHAPWADPLAPMYRVQNQDVGDHVAQHVPWRYYTLRRISEGQWPLWNPHQQLGTPFWPNVQAAIAYPFSIVPHLLLPPQWSWTLVAWLHLWIAGFGAALLLRHLRASWLAATVGGGVFLFSGFMFAWLTTPLQYVIAWMPLCLWATDRLIEHRTGGRWIALTLIMSMAWLGGHPESSVNIMATASLWGLLRLAVGPRVHSLRSIPAFASAVIVSLLLAGLTWVPATLWIFDSAAYALRSAGRHVPDFDPRMLIAALNPFYSGHPIVGAFRPETGRMSTQEAVSGYTGAASLILGIAGAVYLFTRARPQQDEHNTPRAFTHPLRVAWLLVALTFIAILIALETPGISSITRNVPGWQLAPHRRMLVTAAMGVALLAGFGIDAVRRSHRTAYVARLAIVAAIIMAAMAYVNVNAALERTAQELPADLQGSLNSLRRALKNPHYGPPYPHTRYFVEGYLVNQQRILAAAGWALPAATFMLAGVLLMIALRWPRLRLPMAVIVGGVMLIEPLLFGLPYQPGSRLADYVPRSVGIDYVRSQPSARVVTTSSTLKPETASAYGVEDVRGYDAAGNYRLLRYLNTLEKFRRLPSGSIPTLRVQHPAYRLLNAGYLLTSPHDPPPAEHWVHKKAMPDLRIFEDVQAMPRAWIAPTSQRLPLDKVLKRIEAFDFDPWQIVLLEPADQDAPIFRLEEAPSDARVEVKVRYVTPEHVLLEVPAGQAGWLVLADAYTPGWTARVSTDWFKTSEPRPIEPAYGVLRAVAVPEAKDRDVMVEFVYLPPGMGVGMACTFTAGFVVLLVGLRSVAGWRERRNSSAATTTSSSAVSG